MKQSKFYKEIIVGLTLTSLALFGLMFFVYAEIRSKNEKVSMIEQNLSQKNTRYDYLVSMQDLLKQSEENIKKIDSSIVQKTGDVSFIESLEKKARDYNLEVEIESLNLVHDSKNPNSTVATLNIKANVQGLWSNVYLFLSDIESMQYKIKINKFSLKNKDEIPVDRTKTLGLGKNWQGSFELSVLEYK